MRSFPFLACLLACATLAATLAPAVAESTDTIHKFKFFPALFADDLEMKCPPNLSARETPAPYQEGSYQWYGSADFRSFAGPFKLLRQDPFTVVWQADLKAPYANCQGTAAQLAEDGQVSNPYLRMRFLKGKVELVLDMTGHPDVNDYTGSIIYAKLKDGMPIWSVGGSD